MGSSVGCRSESLNSLPISQDIEIKNYIQSLDETLQNSKVIKLEVIYYYRSPSMVIASNFVTVSKFIPGLNLITIPLSLDRDFAHVGLIIFCENNLFYLAHKTAASVSFYRVSDEITAVFEMNTLSQMDYPNQRKYAYTYEVRENTIIKDIYDFIVEKEKFTIYGLKIVNILLKI